MTDLGSFGKFHGHRPPPLRGQIKLVELVVQLGVHLIACPRAVGNAPEQQRPVAVSHHAKAGALAGRHATLLQALPLRQAKIAFRSCNCDLLNTRGLALYLAGTRERLLMQGTPMRKEFKVCLACTGARLLMQGKLKI